MRFAPYVAFFLSGLSSLIFQSVWGRMLHHVFGATSLAISTVLAIFMAGLGLGTWIAGKYAKRIKHPLFAYAIAELLVGLWGLIAPFLLSSDGWLSSVNAGLHQSFGDDIVMLTLGRFACVVPILLIPTTLMGSSLPLLSQHFARHEKDPSRASSLVGTLYAVNTLGAAAGPFLSGFVVMPWLGLAIDNVFACSLNFFLGALIFAFRGYLVPKGEKLSFLPGKTDVEPPKVEVDPNAAPEPAAASDEPWIPPIARKAAVFVFAASGACALCYEVVWSRALAMTVGSSIYSFNLILETFLIGIAAGSAAMAAVMGRGRSPLGAVSIASAVLTLFAMVPWALRIRLQGEQWHEGGLGTWVATSAFPLVVIAGVAFYSTATEKRAQGLAKAGGVDTPQGDPLVYASLVILLVPITCAVLNAVYFSSGYLPKIVASVVASVAVFLALCISLRRHPVLLLAIIQLFIAAATTVSYVWQDEVPYAFAQLVVSLGDRLPDHVGTVQFFTFLTAALCTLPATLGMGASFPLTLRIWTSGGEDVGRDVAVVYTGNTIGSIAGSWLAGFALMPLIGMEETLRAGILLNMFVALVMLIAGAVEGDPDKGKGRELPTWHAITIYVLAPAIPALAALLVMGTMGPHSRLRWNLTQMTLGVFRVSLAEGMLDPESWGQPELVYYEDGLSTTVSVERWGRHYALKNNGKVDASNGDDMPTQITVAAYPLLMHPNGAQNLDVAIVGFGSGVTVGTALSFPVRTVDVIELERTIPEAARFFQSENLLEYTRDSWPYVEMDGLQIINDDGRNYLASTDRQYDVIISEPSNPWITGVSDLFTVDHFRITKRRLRPGGVYCQWVQLYELSPENIKTIYRTFASQYRHVVVFAADDRSSDTVMLGSDAPLTFDIERIRRQFDAAQVGERMTVRDQLGRANLYNPFDVLARVLLSSREEVEQYSLIETRRRGGEEHVNFASHNSGPCAAPECRRDPAILNTDDNARIEFAAPRDLIGFERYEGYLSTIYSPEWPYGRLDEHTRGFGEGSILAKNLAELALSLIAHGRYQVAAEFVERSQAAGRAPETAVALEVLTHLITSEHEPRVRIEPPIPGPEMDRASAERLLRGFDAVRDAVDRAQWASALSAIEEIPAPLRLHSGPALRFLYGYLLYKAADGSFAQYRAAAEQFDDLVRTETQYVQTHPEVFYFLGRSREAESEYGEAARNMRLYVEARLTSSAAGAVEVPEPPANEAPTTDAGGAEADKAVQPEPHP